MGRRRDLFSVARGGYLPESVALVIVGLIVGRILPASGGLISADLVLFIFVPGLVFDAAFDLEWSLVRGLMPALVGLAGPGVLLSTAVVALALHTLAGLPLDLAFVVGAITAATDPVAVVSILARLRMPDRLRTLIEGESLLNDGTGLVLFALAVAAATRGMTAAEGASLFVITIVVSIAAGIAAGAIGALVIRVLAAPALAFAISLVLAYGTYAVSSLVGLSGVLATVVTAVALAYALRRGWSDEVLAQRIDRAWHVVARSLSALTFLSIGVAIDVAAMAPRIAAIAVGVLAVILARALFVYVPLAFTGLRVPRGWAHVIFWSGLRGAIAFAAALSLPAAMPQRDVLQDTSFGIVLVTLVIQGATARLVVERAVGRSAAS